MTTLATITSKNQLTIPKEVMNALNLGKVRRVLISVEDKNLVVKPLVSRVESLAGSLSHLSFEKPVDFKQVRKETRKIVAAKIAKEGI